MYGGNERRRAESDPVGKRGEALQVMREKNEAMEWWNVGMLETGLTETHIIDTSFHYSNIPLFQ